MRRRNPKEILDERKFDPSRGSVSHIPNLPGMGGGIFAPPIESRPYRESEYNFRKGFTASPMKKVDARTEYHIPRERGIRHPYQKREN